MVKPETLNDLIKVLHQIFSSDTVNVEEVQNLMESYESKPQEWKAYAKFDKFRYQFKYIFMYLFNLQVFIYINTVLFLLF